MAAYFTFSSLIFILKYNMNLTWKVMQKLLIFPFRQNLVKFLGRMKKRKQVDNL